MTLNHSPARNPFVFHDRKILVLLPILLSRRRAQEHVGSRLCKKISLWERGRSALQAFWAPFSNPSPANQPLLIRKFISTPRIRQVGLEWCGDGLVLAS